MFNTGAGMLKAPPMPVGSISRWDSRSMPVGSVAAASTKAPPMPVGSVAAASTKCANPECEFLAHPDPSVCVGFCCEKCQGRFNGEEWANSGKGKRRHTALCTSRMDERAAAVAGGNSEIDQATNKCAHPDCLYARNSDPKVSLLYCCPKCEGLHKGEEWAQTGKRHFKSCEKNEKIWGKAAKKAKKAAEAAEWEAHKGSSKKWSGGYGGGSFGLDNGMMEGMQQMMAASMAFWSNPDAIQKSIEAFGGKNDKNDINAYKPKQRIWIGNLPDLPRDELEKMLKEHLNLAGGKVEMVTKLKGNTAAAAFESEEEATAAISQLNGTLLGEKEIEVDAWTGGGDGKKEGNEQQKEDKKEEPKEKKKINMWVIPKKEA